MPEHTSSAVEQVGDGAAERAAVCQECLQAREDLRADVETNEAEHNDKLAAWVTVSYPDILPVEAAVMTALQFQAEERAFDPNFDITAEAPALFEAHIRQLAEQVAARQRNQTTTGQIEDGVPAKVPAEVGQESTLLSDEAMLSVEQAELAVAHGKEQQTETEQLEQRAEKADRNVELRRLQVTFDQLRAEGADTTEALRHVIAQAENPETKQHLNAILGKVAMLRMALPDKPEVVSRLLNMSGLNLAAATVVGSFAGFLEAADTDEGLTDADRQTLRQIIHREKRYTKTGTDVQTELGQTLTTADGQTVPAHPEDKPYQFRDHVHGFARLDGTQHLRAITTHGEQVTLDISGWTGADIGRASELLQLWAMTENEGQTGYLTSLTKLNWSDKAQIDAFALGRASQIVNAMLGGNEGYDGDIFEGRYAIGIIRWQAQLANQTGAALRGNRDETRTHDALIGLGIKDKKGNIDLDALRAFGEYSRDHWMTAPDYQNTKAYLTEHVT